MPDHIVRATSVAALTAACSLSATPARAVSCQDWRDLGDVLRYALPVTSLGLSALYRDGQGAYQYTKTILYTGAATGFFKSVGGKHRPDAGTSEQSFVSGHVSAAMSGASFIYTRYGKGWGIPAYLLAGLTAYSRVCADKHFDDDVLGGTMVALMSNWYATSPYPEHVRIYPSFTSNELKLSWRTFFGGNRQPRDPKNFRPRYKVTFEFGPLKQKTNVVQSPSGSSGGSIVNLDQLEKRTAPTARVLVEWLPKDQTTQDWSIYYSPLGITDFDTPTDSFEFAGVTFNPGVNEIFNSNYRWFDWRVRWRTALKTSGRWTIRVGAGLQYLDTTVRIAQGTQGMIMDQAEVSTGGFGPIIHGSVDYRILPRWKISVQTDGMSNFWDSGDDGYYWNSGLFMNFEASPLWSLGFGTRWILAKNDDSKLFNEFESFDLTFKLTRSF